MQPNAAALLLLIAGLAQQVSGGTRRPVVGVVCHEIDVPPGCFIPASYVKAVEAAGARVAPVFLSRSHDYYRYMVKSLNGVVFPGGYAKTTTKRGYFQAAAEIFVIARKMNYDGDHFPILGVCLGLEFLSILSNLHEINTTLQTCEGLDGTMLPLKFEKGFRSSSLYGGASEQIINILSTKPVTANYHNLCLRPETKLRYPWTILSTNKDAMGKRFVSSMENKDGVMAAVQFHPEKNAYEWEELNPSYEDALLASRHFYDWLVGEARKNSHRFPSESEELKALIYNYNATFSGKTEKNYFTQIYIFPGLDNS